MTILRKIVAWLRLKLCKPKKKEATLFFQVRDLTMPYNQNLLASFSNLIGRATLSMSSGQANVSFPLNNLKLMEMWQPARVGPTSTILAQLDDVENLQLISLLKHNITSTGRWRVRLGMTAGVATGAETPIYDSGWLKAGYSRPGFGTLPWGEFLWGDTISVEYAEHLNQHSFHILSDPTPARVICIDLEDDENEEGFIQISRLWIGGEVYQPSINAQYGAKFLPISKLRSKEAQSGVKFHATRYQRRSLSVQFELPKDELLFNLLGPSYILQGPPGEVIIILQPLAPETWLFEAIYGSVDSIEEPTHSNWKHMSTTLTVDERT